VEHVLAQSEWAIEEAHIFEMVGFCTRTRGSQRTPPGLPAFAAPDVGDFLALLANRHSNGIAEAILKLAATYIPKSPILALKIYFGIEKYFHAKRERERTPQSRSHAWRERGLSCQMRSFSTRA
jgi:hypothetical protein